MGDAGGQGLSVIPSSHRFRHCGQVLQDHEQMGMAAACIAETNRGWAFTDESLESKGGLVNITSCM